MKKEIKITSDGSSTIFIPRLNEHYHSIHGAIRESVHVFIEAGLKSVQGREISIFELGFGTGLNALLTYLEARKNNIVVQYHCFELFPLEREMIRQLNYPESLSLDEEAFRCFLKMHAAEPGKEMKIDQNLLFRMDVASPVQSELPGIYDLVYYDAFSPVTQPELWTAEIFNKIYKSLKAGGKIVTYCAKGDVRRMLQSIGFSTERLPGPPGKHEMLRATK